VKQSTTCEDCRIITLPSIESERKGRLTPIYNSEHIPFDIKRVYYLYDVPAGSERGGHAHRDLERLIIYVSGNFDFVVNPAHMRKHSRLTGPFMDSICHSRSGGN
jgi:hypothetical protein